MADFESILKEYRAFAPDIYEPVTVPDKATYNVPPTQKSPTPPAPPDNPIPDTSKETEPVSETPPTEPPSPLQITEQEHTPVPPRPPRKLQIQTITSPHVASRSQYQVTDHVFCERKVMEYEEAEGRYPYHVGTVMGSEGPRCDVMSFDSEEARRLFESSEVKDLNTVTRFIEVKGRSNEKAEIELRGNELTKAEEYGERYFLYRLYKRDDGDLELAILQNPLIETNACKPAVYISLERAENTHRRQLSGGIME